MRLEEKLLLQDPSGVAISTEMWDEVPAGTVDPGGDDSMPRYATPSPKPEPKRRPKAKVHIHHIIYYQMLLYRIIPPSLIIFTLSLFVTGRLGQWLLSRHRGMYRRGVCRGAWRYVRSRHHG